MTQKTFKDNFKALCKFDGSQIKLYSIYEKTIF